MECKMDVFAEEDTEMMETDDIPENGWPLIELILNFKFTLNFEFNFQQFS